MFPAPDTLPPNVQLAHMDVKHPPPVEQQGQFDLVHVRLLVVAMTEADWPLVVRNLKMLLKPGGALQWEECNYAGARHFRGRTESSVLASRSVGALFRSTLHDRFAYGWSTLHRIFTEEGFTRVEEDMVSSDRVVETREALTVNGNFTLIRWARQMAGAGVSGFYSMKEIDGLEEQLQKDAESGCYGRYDIHVITGFKVT